MHDAATLIQSIVTVLCTTSLLADRCLVRPRSCSFTLSTLSLSSSAWSDRHLVVGILQLADLWTRRLGCFTYHSHEPLLHVVA